MKIQSEKDQPWPLVVYFKSFQSNILEQINVKIVHLVFGTGIRTHNLLIMSLLSLPLDQGSIAYEDIDMGMSMT